MEFAFEPPEWDRVNVASASGPTAVHLDSAWSLPSTFTDMISLKAQVNLITKVGIGVVSISQMTQCPGIRKKYFFKEVTKAKWSAQGHSTGLISIPLHAG